MGRYAASRRRGHGVPQGVPLLPPPEEGWWTFDGVEDLAVANWVEFGESPGTRWRIRYRVQPSLDWIVTISLAKEVEFEVEQNGIIECQAQLLDDGDIPLTEWSATKTADTT